MIPLLLAQTDEALKSYTTTDVWIIGSFIGLACTTISGFVGFWFGVIKNKAEIAQLTAEAAKDAGELLSKVQLARKAFNEACIGCGKASVRLDELIGTSDRKEEFHLAREMLCESLFHQVIPTYLEHIEWRQLQHKVSDPDVHSLMVED